MIHAMLLNLHTNGEKVFEDLYISLYVSILFVTFLVLLLLFVLSKLKNSTNLYTTKYKDSIVVIYSSSNRYYCYIIHIILLLNILP